MLRNVSDVYEWFACTRRAVVPLLVACFLLCAFVPGVLAASSGRTQGFSLVGPKQYYLALGDSLAFGYQPDFDFSHGYVDDFYSNLQRHGVTSLANMGCPGETSSSFINGGCPRQYMRKYPYMGAQLNAAIAYLKFYAGKVSPVTLDIGAGDVLPDINTSTCMANDQKFQADLNTLDTNLTRTILPQLRAALTVNGRVTGDIVMMNYYDPFQNICPNSVSYIRTFNAHLANDVSKFGTLVDVFSAFGGARTPNQNTCTYTWMCSMFPDMHPQDKGYSVIAAALESRIGY